MNETFDLIHLSLFITEIFCNFSREGLISCNGSIYPNGFKLLYAYVYAYVSSNKTRTTYPIKNKCTRSSPPANLLES